MAHSSDAIKFLREVSERVHAAKECDLESVRLSVSGMLCGLHTEALRSKRRELYADCSRGPLPGGTDTGVRRAGASLEIWQVLAGAMQVVVRGTGSAGYEAQCSSNGPTTNFERSY